MPFSAKRTDIWWKIVKAAGNDIFKMIVSDCMQFVHIYVS